jgi:cysteine desulfurase
MPIYLDHASTTPLRSEALDAMYPFLTEQFGNASSAHSFGRKARAALDEAHERVAARLHAEPREIIFTSGGTEANNLAIKGAAWAGKARGHRIVTSPVEHHAVGHTLEYLARFGFEIAEVPVDRYGRVDPDELDAAITDRTILVTIMLANNEVGTIQPLAEIAALVRPRGIPLHTDAVQAAGALDLNVEALGVDLLSLAGHKIYGPKGVGALYVRRRNPRVLLSEQISGGGHERGMRSGTLNVPGIVSLGKAAEICKAEMATEADRLRQLRDYLNAGLHKNLDELYINGSMEHRLPHNLNISFAYVEGESLLMGINDVAVSSGSACTSASLEPSYVLKALGAGDDLAHSSIRFGLGRWTTKEEVDYVVDKLTNVVQRLREMSPLYEMVKEGVDLTKMTWVTH